MMMSAERAAAVSVDFSSVPRTSLIGRLLRRMLRVLPAGQIVRVLQGPLRGARWIIGAATHGCWLGSYEADKQARFVAMLRPGATVMDIGANVGFYTLLAARYVGDTGTVLAVEPNERNLFFLRRHVALNCATNVTVVGAAAGGTDGTARFSFGVHALMGHLTEDGSEIVLLRSLDSLQEELGLRPVSVMKIDVEGAEADVLAGAERILTADRPIIFLATHGDEVASRCLRILRDRHYHVRPLDARVCIGAADEFIALPSTLPAARA